MSVISYQLTCMIDKYDRHKPFDDRVQAVMTEKVKSSLCNCLTADCAEKTHGKVDFLGEADTEKLNLVKCEVCKNSSTATSARLNKDLAVYIDWIGQITCGNVGGTCFLVADKLVITNYHVYRMIKKEKARNTKFRIIVNFDYFSRKQSMMNAVFVHENNDPNIENAYLDYKFFKLEDSPSLQKRIPLGPYVRNWQLSDDRVVIVRHPRCEEMKNETCVVFGYRRMHDVLRARCQKSGIHMTNKDLLDKTEDYQNKLSYDTTFFSGASGSPVFDISGTIVAMHTQGYIISTSENDSIEDYTIQQETSKTSKQKKMSVIEFGVQFIVICRDIKRLYGEEVLLKLFPNYNLKPGEERMEQK